MENTRKHPFTLIIFATRSSLFSANTDKCKPGLKQVQNYFKNFQSYLKILPTCSQNFRKYFIKIFLNLFKTFANLAKKLLKIY